ncbi:MAG: hypothetical protein IPN29_09365 [Saprospiraceae bacterium]|nr:hypothetical protein [Saprospiraceae bacterium]
MEILFELQHRVALIHPGTLKAVVKVDRNKTDEIDAKELLNMHIDLETN